MRIAYIAAGAAGMYCGSCLHDNTLAAALAGLGHDVTLVPTYTPIRTDETDVSVDRVFYGAVNVYLAQKLPFFRRTPRLVDRLFNNRALLDRVARLAGSTDARSLGALTLSVLAGEHGHQRKELDRLVRWLADEIRPEIVHLTNTMMLGLARPMRRELGVPVVCSVQGEDLFLDGLHEPYRSRVRQLLQQRAGDASALVATSRYYADFMAGYLQVPRSHMRQARLGVKLDGIAGEPSRLAERPFVIGYLARVCPEKGLHLLAEAFRLVAERIGAGAVRLRVAGYMAERDRQYVDDVRQRLADAGLAGSVDFVGEVSRQGKIEFLRSLHVLSVPTVYREPKGLFVLEALACGVPVVQPRHGSFPEMLEATGGGILVDPDSAPALAGGLLALIGDPARRSELASRGQRVTRQMYSDEAMARETLGLYESILAGERDETVPYAAEDRVR